MGVARAIQRQRDIEREREREREEVGKWKSLCGEWISGSSSKFHGDPGSPISWDKD